jgi:hypothetical protein
MSKTVFKAGQEDVVSLSLDIDDPVRFQSRLTECGSEKIRACKTPDHRAAGSSQDPGCKQGCSSGMKYAGTSACDFVEAAKSQPAFREAFINSGNAKWEDFAGSAATGSNLSDASAQIDKAGG